MTSIEKAGRAPASNTRVRKAGNARSASWQLQDAKARFSEVVRRAKLEGPQHVTVHGREEVVVVGAEDYRKLAGERTGQALIDAMQQFPHRSTNIEPSRSRMRVRAVEQ
jgi:prevent-host-death family protein